MDHLTRSGSRHLPPQTGKQSLPSLIRCKSETPSTSPPRNLSSNKSNTSTKSRSVSTSKTRNLMINIPSPTTVNTRITSPSAKKKMGQDRTLPRKKPTSPSAWALSPGRVAPCPSPVMAKSPSPSGKSSGERGGGGISGVLKYFRNKKGGSSEEADRRCLNLMNNRLLQWRFANARAETAMSTVQNVAKVTQLTTNTYKRVSKIVI